jgi:transcriptional regulator with XRE-family HTH domain
VKETAVRDEIARRLRAAVQAAGATQAEMARRLSIKQPTFNRYLRGERDMPEEEIGRLAEATGFDRDVLLFGRGRREQLRRLEEFLEKPKKPIDIVSFIAAPSPSIPSDWHALTKEERAAINQIIRLIARRRGAHRSNNDTSRE